MTTVKLIDISVTSKFPALLCFFFGGGVTLCNENLNMACTILTNLSVHGTVLLSRGVMGPGRYLELIHLV